MIPVQPFLQKDAYNYKEQREKKLGIAQFYEFTVQADAQVFRAVPDGSTDLVFGINETDTRIYIGGTVLQAKGWEFEEGRTYFGARFLPGRCILPKDLQIKEIVNTDLELDPYAYGSSLIGQMAEQKTMADRSRLLVEHFAHWERVQEKETISAIERYCRSRIYATQGLISVKELAAETGYTEVYIRRIFQRIHGISPKVFEQFVRFQNLLQAVQRDTTERRFDEIAYDCGYYDQSHMIKDFKRFAGTTPEQYQECMKETKNKNSGRQKGE